MADLNSTLGNSTAAIVAPLHYVDAPFSWLAYVLSLVILFIGFGIPYLMIKSKTS